MNDTLDKAAVLGHVQDRVPSSSRTCRPGTAATWPSEVNEAEGRGDASLRTKAEYSALFDALLKRAGFRGGSRHAAPA